MPENESTDPTSTGAALSPEEWLKIAAEEDPDLVDETVDVDDAGVLTTSPVPEGHSPDPAHTAAIGDVEVNQPVVPEPVPPAFNETFPPPGGTPPNSVAPQAPTPPQSQWRAAAEERQSVPPRDSRYPNQPVPPGGRFDNFQPQQTQFPSTAGPRPGWAGPPAPQQPSPPMPPMPPTNLARQQEWRNAAPAPRQPGYNGAAPYQPGYNAAAPHQPGTFELWQSQPGGAAPGAQPPNAPGAVNMAASTPMASATPGPEYGRPNSADAGYLSMAPAESLADKYNQQKYASSKKPEPQSGWRKGVFKGTFGAINPGESGPEKEDRLLREKINNNIRGQFVFAVLSLKGGMANSTTTAGIGSIFAQTRGAEVIALDINPDSGNLASRINPAAKHTFVDVLRDNGIEGRTDVRSYTEQNAVKLDVLASSEQLVNPPTYTPETLRATVDKLRRAYTVIGLDCGKSINSPLVPAVLDMVNAIVVVTSVASDGFRGALILHDWLRAHGRSQLLERSFLLMSDQDSKKNPKMKKGIEDDVAKIIWKDPAYIPYDPHIHEGAVINLDQLAEPTYRALLKATGRLADWYNMPPLPMLSGLHA